MINILRSLQYERENCLFFLFFHSRFILQTYLNKNIAKYTSMFLGKYNCILEQAGSHAYLHISGMPFCCYTTAVF